MPPNYEFVNEPPAIRRRDSNDAVSPSYEGGKSFMSLVLSTDCLRRIG